MEFDYSKLRGRIVEKFKSIGRFCDEYGITATSMSEKLNNKSRFSQLDIIKMSEMLNIKPDEIAEYFFTLKV